MNNTENLDRSRLFGEQFSSWDTDQLKCMLMDYWAQLSQSTSKWAINQLTKRLTTIIKLSGANIEFRLV